MSESERERGGLAPIVIESVHVRNFRGLTDVALDLDPKLTLLVGRNNCGKSRILRAIAVALGAVPADVDDFTISSSHPPTIDVVVAPAASSPEGLFVDDVGQILDPQPTQDGSERFAWRTTISRSAEGVGAVRQDAVLTLDPADGWFQQSAAQGLTREQRRLLAADLIATQRDLAVEMGLRGSAIRRILNDLELPTEVRESIEGDLEALSARIVGESRTLAAVEASLKKAESRVGGFGQPTLSPIPARIEELSRSVSLDLDTGTGGIPLRLHGSGPKSLASLLVQSVLYDRRMGKDGPDRRPHPVTLVEEPEAHLHPQMQAELPGLLAATQGQLVVSSHSVTLATEVDHKSIRLVRRVQPSIISLAPAESSPHRLTHPDHHVEEVEKLKRQVERPFGELLFASAVVLGDGATERALLPSLLRHALGSRAHAISVIDPGSMGSPLTTAVLKFADAVGIPWHLFADGDPDGRKAAERVARERIGQQEPLEKRITYVHVSAPTEQMFIEHSPDVCKAALANVIGASNVPAILTVGDLKKSKGALGRYLAEALIAAQPSIADWPESLRLLIESVRLMTDPSAKGADDGV
jgi:putative ATP-dependent endonuclease of OLD family